MSLIDTDKCRAMESGIFHTIVIFAINEQIKSHSTETNRTSDIRSWHLSFLIAKNLPYEIG